MPSRVLASGYDVWPPCRRPPLAGHSPFASKDRPGQRCKVIMSYPGKLARAARDARGELGDVRSRATVPGRPASRGFPRPQPAGHRRTQGPAGPLRALRLQHLSHPGRVFAGGVPLPSASAAQRPGSVAKRRLSSFQGLRVGSLGPAAGVPRECRALRSGRAGAGRLGGVSTTGYGGANLLPGRGAVRRQWAVICRSEAGRCERGLDAAPLGGQGPVAVVAGPGAPDRKSVV